MNLLYYSPSMERLARSAAASCRNTMLGHIDWDHHPDLWPKIRFEDRSRIEGACVFFLAGMEYPKDVFEQISVMYAIPDFDAEKLTVILPHFPTGQEDRLDADENGEEEPKVATAKTLACMLSAIPSACGGPARIVTYDVHALQEKFFFGDSVKVKLRSAVPLLRDVLHSIPDVAVALPDEGARKRFSAMLKGFPLILCSKGPRDANGEPTIRIESGDPRGKHVVIVDDVGQGGGTVYQCMRAVEKQSPKSVSAYNTHAVFPGNAWQRFIGSSLANYWITNSRPSVTQSLDGRGPFKVLSLEALITHEIIRTAKTTTARLG